MKSKTYPHLTWDRAPIIRLYGKPNEPQPLGYEGRLPTALGASYYLEDTGRGWSVAWVVAPLGSYRNLGTFTALDAAKAVSQEHADQWEGFGELWHSREHHGPSPTDAVALESFLYFQSGLTQGRRESL